VALSRNLLVGVLNSAWVAVTGLIVVPFYLKYLGIDAYGLIGFFLTLQALFQLLDMGLAPTINREVARCSVSGNMHEARNLLHSLAVIYFAMAIGIATMVFFLAPFIAQYWLQSENISQHAMTMAIKLMGLVIACRWPIGLYQGALMGAQRLIISSSINIVMVTLGSLGSISILAFVSPTIEAFFIWQACVGLIYICTIRREAWKVIGKEAKSKFDIAGLKRIWRFSVGMSAVALSGLVFTQLDKVLLSKMLALSEFGHYMLATTVVSALYLLVIPFFNVIYPRFSALVEKGSTEELIKLYRVGTRLMASILFPIAMLLFLFAQDFVFVWTGDHSVSLSVGPLISILAIGSALHGVMYFPYALQLSYGMSRLPLIINCILMVIMIPLIIILVPSYGALGGAVTWLVLHVLYLMLGTWITHRHLLKGTGGEWLVKDVGIPLILTALLSFLGYFVLEIAEYSPSPYIRLVLGLGLALSAFSISVALSSQLRFIVISKFEWTKKVSIN